MGIVYKAEDSKLNRKVALKFLPLEMISDQEAHLRFEREAKAAAALNHPNIVTIYEIDEFAGQTYIAMEYVAGETLTKSTSREMISIETIIDIAIQVCEGLAEAHHAGIVHRDIKHQNIMLDKSSRVKILDFGLAKLRGTSKITKEIFRIGTAAYMSPEQARGADVDHRTDIWSLGVVLYEIITGQLPFRRENEQAVIYAIINETPKPITELRAGVPMELERIVNKALSKDPSERYQQVNHLLVDLQRLKEGLKPGVTLSKIKTSPEVTIKASRKFLVLTGFILAAILIAAGFFLFKEKPGPGGPVIEPPGKPSLAVVYFENKSGDESLDNWREAFSELLSIDLSQSRYIRVLRSDEIYSIFKQLNLLEAKKYSVEDLREIAKKGGVNRILKGSYIKAGDNFVITAVLINADSGETISSLFVKAKGEKNIFAKVDDLTKKIKLELDLTPDQVAGDIDKEVGEITTNSPEALRYYSEGIKYYYKGEFSKSIPLMEKAAAIDPEFAMAYRTLSADWGNMGYASKEKMYIQKSFKLKDRISERERYRIQGHFYSMSEETFNKAIDALNKLLLFYPDDWIGNNMIGLLYMELEEWDKAIERFEVNIRNKFAAFQSYGNQARAYAFKRLYDRAREVLENYRFHFPDIALVHRHLLYIYLAQGKYDLALVEADKAISLDPSADYLFLASGIIYQLRGDFIRAEKQYRKFLESKEQLTILWRGKEGLGALYLLQGKFQEAAKQIKQGIQMAVKFNNDAWEESWLHSFLAYINLESGNQQEAMKEFEKALNSAVKAITSDFQVYALNGKGLTYLEMKSMELVKTTADELKRLTRQGMNKKRIRFYYHLKGEIELKKDNFSRAMEYFKRAISLLPSQYQYGYFIKPSAMHALFMNSLASAYFKSGNLEKAIEEYEGITSLIWGRFYYGDIYARAFYHLGKIYQQKDWKGKAIENYNKFIQLWKACDPQFQPLVQDARKQVDRLKKR